MSKIHDDNDLTVSAFNRDDNEPTVSAINNDDEPTVTAVGKDATVIMNTAELGRCAFRLVIVPVKGAHGKPQSASLPAVPRRSAAKSAPSPSPALRRRSLRCLSSVLL